MPCGSAVERSWSPYFGLDSRFHDLSELSPTVVSYATCHCHNAEPVKTKSVSNPANTTVERKPCRNKSGLFEKIQCHKLQVFSNWCVIIRSRVIQVISDRQDVNAYKGKLIEEYNLTMALLTAQLYRENIISSHVCACYPHVFAVSSGPSRNR